MRIEKLLLVSAPKSDHSDYIRERLTRQVIGTSAPNVSTKDGQPSYQEQFVSPQTNMIAYFLAKVCHFNIMDLMLVTPQKFIATSLKYCRHLFLSNC